MSPRKIPRLGPAVMAKKCTKACAARVQHVCSTCKIFFGLTAYRAFSHDVTTAILLFQNMFQNKETAAMFGYVGVPRKSSGS